ncbi:MAG: transporter substrate-binding domain-containing protein [Rhodomicrobium sp.]
MRFTRLLGAKNSAKLLAGFLFALAIALCGMEAPARAQSCGSDYAIQEGESLADIATRVYGNASQWTLIFYANQDRMGANASMLAPGLTIRIPCVAGQQPSAAPVAQAARPAEQPAAAAANDGIELSSAVRRMEFLTADGLTPFSDRSLLKGGMMTHIATAAMDLIKDQSAGAFSYNVSWVNDWAAHLNPLLITRAFDAGMPWIKPDCGKLAELSSDAKYRCQKFFFSDPIFEVFTVLFVKSDSAIAFAKDEEIVGKTLCQPAGFSTYELDKGGRNWVKDNKIVLMQPQTIEDCFRLLDSGTVSAVVTSDLTGKAVASALGLGDRVKNLQRPLAIGSYHLIVPKTHPHASTMLYYFNTAIGKLRESGEFDRIVDSHLSKFWSAQERK